MFTGSHSSPELDILKLNNVLVLHKKSTYQLQAEEYKDERFLELLRSGHESVQRVKIAHEEHISTIETVKKELESRKINFRIMPRADLQEPVKNVDLLISVGGDGTFLDASHSLESIPMLGVNSSSSSSFGHFCFANRANFGARIDGIRDGTISSYPIMRLELEINGKVLPERPLNEILVAHSNPAATSRYFMEIDGVKDEQRSSGVWICTPAGSTGSMRSAGGIVQPITEKKFQYLVREPCIRPGDSCSHLRGFLRRDQEIVVVSQMRTGNIFVDGPHIECPFGLGDTVVVRASKQDLIAFVDPDVNKMFQSRTLADVECK